MCKLRIVAEGGWRRGCCELGGVCAVIGTVELAVWIEGRGRKGRGRRGEGRRHEVALFMGNVDGCGRGGVRSGGYGGGGGGRRGGHRGGGGSGRWLVFLQSQRKGRHGRGGKGGYVVRRRSVGACSEGSEGC